MDRDDVSVEKLIEQSEFQFENEDYLAAKKTLLAAKKIATNKPEIWSNLAYINYLLGKYSEGESSARQAINLNPKFVAAYSNLSLILSAQHRYQESVECLNAAIKVDPNMADLWINLGLSYMGNYQIENARNAFAKAIALVPNSAVAYCNLALCEQETGQVEKAYKLYQKALEFDSNLRPAISNRLMCAQYHPSLTSKELKDAAIHATQSIDVRDSNQVEVSTRERLRIGFVGGDFRAHPVGWFLKDVFVILARHFDCYCYANQTEKEDAIFKQFFNAARHWHNIYGLNKRQVVEIIKQDNIDVLIDLSGHTAANRLDVFADRIASFQISWLGYPASTGLTNIDAVLLSDDLIVQSSSSFFCEKVLALPGPQFVYRAPSYLPELSEPPCLKNGYITYGCFNNIAKINDSVLCCWASLLCAVPSARLLLKWKTLVSPSVVNIILKRLHTLGIESSRVDCRGVSPHKEMLQEYNEVDIALDPFPFSGALTSFEAISMGVPVITLYTDRPISRQTYSINKALGLDEFSVKTPRQYVKIAHQLANDVEYLTVLRKNLRGSMRESQLYNYELMANQFMYTISDLYNNHEKSPA